MRQIVSALLGLTLLAVATPAAAQQTCQTGMVTTRYQPPVHIELGGGESYRWASYGIHSFALGVDLPFARNLSAGLGAQLHTAGQREIWLTDFESTYALVQLEGGVRVRLASPTRRFAPTAQAQFYAIPKVEPGLQGDLGVEMWTSVEQRFGLRLSAGAAWSPGRPISPTASLRLLMRSPATH